MRLWGSLAVQDGQRLSGNLGTSGILLMCGVNAGEKWGALGRGVAFTFLSNPMGNYYYFNFTEEERGEQKTSATCPVVESRIKPRRVWLPSSVPELSFIFF